MEDFIFYPGQDPVRREFLKTFLSQADGITFFFNESSFQQWDFNNGFDRDQALAFLTDQYTDRRSFLFYNDKSTDPVIEALIGLEEIVLTHRSGAKTDPELSGVEFHLFVLDLINDGNIKYKWSDKARIPYPVSSLPKYKDR